MTASAPMVAGVSFSQQSLPSTSHFGQQGRRNQPPEMRCSNAENIRLHNPQSKSIEFPPHFGCGAAGGFAGSVTGSRFGLSHVWVHNCLKDQYGECEHLHAAYHESRVVGSVHQCQVIMHDRQCQHN